MAHQSSNSELNEVLYDYARYVRADHKTTTHIGLSADEAKAAILANYTPNSEVDRLVAEVIGKNDKGAYEPADKYKQNHRNELRREQRKRYEALKRGGK